MKTVYAKLSPDMNRDDKIRNLIAAIEKSGFAIKPGRRPGNPQPDGLKPEAGISICHT